VGRLPEQLDLFPNSEPEIKGQLAALAVLVTGLIETLIENGSLTQEQAKTLCHHSDLKTTFAIWDGLQGEMPDAELRRMEEQATRFLNQVRQGIS
jgi:polyhydroxyalkanoate synthesis regulator phasin